MALVEAAAHAPLVGHSRGLAGSRRPVLAAAAAHQQQQHWRPLGTCPAQQHRWRSSSSSSNSSSSSRGVRGSGVAARVQASESSAAADVPAPAAPPARSTNTQQQPWWSSPYDPAILALALPAALALAADPVLGMVDTALVGRLGPEELAALGINTSVFTLSFVVFNFLATALTPMLATALGQRNRQAAGEVVWQATGLAALLGCGVAATLLAHADWLLQTMGSDPVQQQHMHQLALEYLSIRATAAPAVLLVTVGQGVFRGLANMRAPLLITLGTNALHLLLDLLLMYQLHWGIRGAAASTAASEWLAAGAYAWMVWQRRDALALWPPPRVPASQLRARMAPFLHAGSAVMLRTGSLLGTKTLATAVAARLGTSPVASHQVLMQVWVLSSMLVDSLAVSGQTLVAVSLGRGQPGTARAISERLLQLGLGLGCGLAVLAAAGGQWWPGLFSSDDAVLGQIHALLPLAVAPLPINSLVYVLDGILVGASDFNYLMTAMICASAVAASMLLCVEPSGTGLQGVWAALAVLMVGRLATLGWRFQAAGGPLPPSRLALLAQEQQQHGQGQAHADSSSSSSSDGGADDGASSSQLRAAEVTAPLLLLNNSVASSDGLRQSRQRLLHGPPTQKQQQAVGSSRQQQPETETPASLE